MTTVKTLFIIAYSITIALFIITLFIRNYGIFQKTTPRLNIFKTEGAYLQKVLKLFFFLGLLIMTINIPVYGFIGLAPRSIVPEFLTFSLMIVSFLIIITEIPRCFSLAESTLKKTAKKIWFTAAVLIIFPLSVYFAYYIPQIFHFPPPSECIILELPVKERWFAGHAGESVITNQHNYLNSQKYAVDMVKLNDDRTFYNNQGNELTDYPTFGAPVFAPCSGVIATVVDSIADIDPSLTASNPDNPAGNYIALRYADSTYVILAHLKLGSTKVLPGDSVITGQHIADVGNSGNTTWPHLHIHVQNLPEIDFDAQSGIPFRFKRMNRKRWFNNKEVENAILLRNDVFSNL